MPKPAASQRHLLHAVHPLALEVQTDVFAIATTVTGMHANKMNGVISDLPATDVVLLLAAQCGSVGDVCSNCAKW